MERHGFKIARRLRTITEPSISHPLKIRLFHNYFFNVFAGLNKRHVLVFPACTRFEHSLGTMHLVSIACKTVQTTTVLSLNALSTIILLILRRKVSLDVNHGTLSPTFDDVNKIFECDYTFQVIRLAALMHDIGHLLLPQR